MPGGSWQLIGRHDELALIEAELSRDGSAGVVVVGPMGAGKTRLVREAVDRAGRAGRATEWFAAAGGSAAVPFGPAAHLLRDTDLLAPRVQVIRLVAEQLRGRGDRRRTVLGVDDAHLLDPATATLVHYLAVARAAVVLLTVRADEAVPDQVTALWKEQAAVRLDLGPLSQNDTTAMLEALLGDQVDGAVSHELYRLSAGNPLYLRELTAEAVRAGALVRAGRVWRRGGSLATPSHGLSDLLWTRLRRLDPELRQAVELVSLAEPADVELLESAGVPRRQLENAEETGLLVTVEVGQRIAVRLAHPLYGETIRARMPVLRRQRLYRTLATALDTIAPAGTNLVRRAQWRLAARLPAEPATLVAAARQAMAALDRDLALRLAEAAAGDAGAGLLVAELLAWQGRADEAEHRFAELDRTASTDEELALAVRGRALNLALGLNRLADAREVVARALDRLHDPVCRLEVAGITVVLALHANSPRRAEQAWLELPVIEPPPRLALASIPSVVIMLTLHGLTDQAQAYAEHGLGQLRAADDPDRHVVNEMTERSLVNALLLAGQVSDAGRLVDERYRLALESRADDHRAVWGMLRGAVALAAGRLNTATRWLREASVALDEQPSLGGPAGRLLCLGLLAQSAAQGGDTAAAVEAIRRGHPVATDDLLVPEYGLAKAWEAASRSDLGAARRLAIEVATTSAAEGNVAGQLLAWRDVNRFGDATAALAGLRAVPAEGPAAEVYVAHAEAAADADAARLLAVADRMAGLGLDLLAAEAAAQAADAYLRTGHTVRAAAATDRAGVLRARCEGARTPLLALVGADSVLSERERQVAVLAGRGRSNRAIADQLSVSVRTVENHLHHVFGKLGITRRSQLAELFDPFGQESSDAGPAAPGTLLE